MNQAVNDWHDLDAPTRAALLRGEPATDPETDRIVRAYAAPMLKRVRIRLGVIGTLGALVVGPLLGYLAVLAHMTLVEVLPVFIAIWIGWAIVVTRRKRPFVRLLKVSHRTPPEPVVPGSSEHL